jgi:lipopolysaccharide biosynthesis glycosyltransferase
VAPEKLHIALGFDERFWAPAYATMRSVCLFTLRRSDLVFHLCHPGLSASALADLDKISAEFGATLVQHDLREDEDYVHFAATLPHTKYISEVMYGRLLVDRFVPGVERLVYLDCDILVRAPIEQLIGSELEGRTLGAVRDPHAVMSSNGRDVMNNRDLLGPANPFFNSGVLVMDMAKWRAMDIAGTLRRLQREGTLSRLTNDQQILNYLFQRNWTEIDPSWNTFAASPGVVVFHPKAVHYTGLQKPWNLVTFLPFQRVYRHVMTNELFYRYMRLRWAQWWLRLGRRLIGRG